MPIEIVQNEQKIYEINQKRITPQKSKRQLPTEQYITLEGLTQKQKKKNKRPNTGFKVLNFGGNH